MLHWPDGLDEESSRRPPLAVLIDLIAPVISITRRLITPRWDVWRIKERHVQPFQPLQDWGSNRRITELAVAALADVQLHNSG